MKYIMAPPFCFYCRTYLDEYDPLCVQCLHGVKPILSTRIQLKNDIYMHVYALSAYEEPLKSFVVAKGRSDYIASKKLGNLLWHHSVLSTIPFDYIVPLPLHWIRHMARGYNQAEVMAKEVSRLSGKPVLNCLVRTKRTAKQSSVKTIEKHKNVSDAFVLTQSIEGKAIVLIDDVMTSGATLYEAGKTLLEGNPLKIYAIVACRVV